MMPLVSLSSWNGCLCVGSSLIAGSPRTKVWLEDTDELRVTAALVTVGCSTDGVRTLNRLFHRVWPRKISSDGMHLENVLQSQTQARCLCVCCSAGVLGSCIDSRIEGKRAEGDVQKP